MTRCLVCRLPRLVNLDELCQDCAALLNVDRLYVALLTPDSAARQLTHSRRMPQQRTGEEWRRQQRGYERAYRQRRRAAQRS